MIKLSSTSNIVIAHFHNILFVVVVVVVVVVGITEEQRNKQYFCIQAVFDIDT